MPHLSDDGLLVSLQNGINPPLLEEKVGPDRTVGVAIRMGSTRPAPGQVRTTTRGHLYVGHLHGKKTPQLERLNALLDSVIPSEISDNITRRTLEQAHLYLPGIFRLSRRCGIGHQLFQQCGPSRARRLFCRSRRRRQNSRGSFHPAGRIQSPRLSPQQSLRETSGSCQ